MEIGPIPGIRAVAAVKALPADPRLFAVFDVENSAGPGDDTYSGSGRKALGGQDDEDDAETVEVESATESSINGGSVNFVV